MNRNLKGLWCGLWLILASTAYSQSWNLPQPSTAKNTTVHFEVDSTWHLVKGNAPDISGKIWLEDPKDYRTIRADVSLAVAAFDTESESRDERLREVMHSDQHPVVQFKVERNIADLCRPEEVLVDHPCSVSIPAILTINGVSREVVLRSTIAKVGSAFEIDGTTTIKWRDFNVDDPSILIAKLHEDVAISIHLSLKEVH